MQWQPLLQVPTSIPTFELSILTHIVVVAVLSDRFRIRGVMMLVTLPLAIIGYAVIANTDSMKVKYGMTFLMATGLYTAVPCVLGWISNNSAGHYKRATTTAAQLAIANSGGFVAGKFPSYLSTKGAVLICLFVNSIHLSFIAGSGL